MLVIATLVGYVSIFSLLALVYAPIMLWIEWRGGIHALEDAVNQKFNDRKLVALFQVAGILAVIAWVVCVFNFFLGDFSRYFEDRVLHTYLGDLPWKYANLYFISMFINVLGAKGAMAMSDLAQLRKQGPIMVRKRGIFLLWSPLE